MYKNWPGNKRLESIVKHHLTEYSKAQTKSQKSELVSLIMDQVLQQPSGEEQQAYPQQQGQLPVMFVRYIQGRWYQIDDGESREKIGRMLRDRLHTQYRSSSKSKVAKRREANINKSKERREAALASASSSATAEVVGSSSSSSKDVNCKEMRMMMSSAASAFGGHAHHHRDLLMNGELAGGSSYSSSSSCFKTRPNSNINDLLDEACDVVCKLPPKRSSNSICSNHQAMLNNNNSSFSSFMTMMTPSSSSSLFTTTKVEQQQPTVNDDILDLFGYSAPTSSASIHHPKDEDEEFNAFMNGEDIIVDLESGVDDHLDLLHHDDIVVNTPTSSFSATEFDW